MTRVVAIIDDCRSREKYNRRLYECYHLHGWAAKRFFRPHETLAGLGLEPVADEISSKKYGSALLQLRDDQGCPKEDNLKARLLTRSYSQFLELLG
ncbi:MAG: hypothetical protein M1438_11320 [Deltaproteobacteria bacterium]|nr:hypothetical protein [Deltaproteobacteria bacterium]